MSAPVVVVAVFFAGMGALALVRPAVVVGVFGLRLDRDESANEVRAVYGGFGLVVAAVLLAGDGRSDSFGDGLIAAVALSLVGMAAGRVIDIAIQRRVDLYPTACFIVVELALAGLLAVSL